MKTIVVIIMMAILNSSCFSQADSLFVITKSDAITLANKIQLLRDSVQYNNAVIITQDSLISLQRQNSLVFKQQLENKDELFKIIKRENQVLRETIVSLEPKWYDNKFIWFLSGVATATLIVLVK